MIVRKCRTSRVLFRHRNLISFSFFDPFFTLRSPAFSKDSKSVHGRKLVDSLHSINLTRSHKILSVFEQTLKMGRNDASGQGLQSALKNIHQNKFSREIYESKTYMYLFSSYFHLYSPFPTSDPHTILKNSPPR
jgi:hypothetical protein